MDEHVILFEQIQHHLLFVSRGRNAQHRRPSAVGMQQFSGWMPGHCLRER